MEAAVIIMVIAIAFIYLILFALLIAQYIISSLAIQKLANKNGVSNSWLAWIPYASSWLVGAITDEYDSRNGMERNWKKLLLVLTIAGTGVVTVGYFFYIIIVILGSATAAPAVMGVGMILFYLVIFVGAYISSARGFCYAICIYKMFEAEATEKAIKYLLIYLLVPFGGPICLMKCAKQEIEEESEDLEPSQIEDISDSWEN